MKKTIVSIFQKDRSDLGWLAALAIIAMPTFGGDLQVKLKGFGFVHAGRLMHVTDTLDQNWNGNWMEAASAQVVANIIVDEHWDGAVGVGAAQEHKLQGRTGDARNLTMDIRSYISQSRFSYTQGDREKPLFQGTFGYFPFNYNKDIRNLGLYLTRGTVYPGYLISGFETKDVMPIANTLGLRLNSNIGNFTQDLLLTSEIENRPYLDYSLIYVAKYAFGDGLFNLGAGVNFYHLIPANPDLTTPDLKIFNEYYAHDKITHPYDYWYIYVDSNSIQTIVMDSSAGPESPVACPGGDYAACVAVDPAHRYLYLYGDTVQYTHRGIKTDIFFSFQPQKLFGLEFLGEQDLKLYGEAAIIGVKNYPGIYDDIAQRIPVMLGFNIPAFKLLDNLSLEVEYYGALFQNNLKGVNEEQATVPISTLQMDRIEAGDSLVVTSGTYPNADPYNLNHMVQDNWKWSLHGSRVFGGHLKVSAQVASDHFRPLGTGIAKTYHTAFSDTFQDGFPWINDWYWMMKFSYFF